MTTKTRMKLQCVSKMELPDGSSQILLQALYEGAEGENHSFADATPSANLSFVISKGRPAADMFTQGENYYADIENVASVRERESASHEEPGDTAEDLGL